ncbi:type I restriction-modification system subunit M [Arthrobacter koreensis]|uniref:type I restriction-modification system subunit M n=1 Tax=Arthrobacter koreensis TaxID=199136 RepID=UPI003AD03823
MTSSTESGSTQGVRAVALKKSDLYSSLWKSCDELRGGMDASQYKDYILTMLFMKYVSDKAKTDPNSLIEVPEGGSFDDMVALKGDKEIGDKINKIIAKLADSNGLQQVITMADFDDEEKLGKAKEMVDRLSKLITIFQELDFRGSRAEGDDLLGDAYEYLMRHFATESGKSKGQFYTPAEVSRVLAKLIGVTGETPRSATVYDPTCGSGSLLLKVAAESSHGLTIYGQEKDNATWALSKMNMILHGNEIADIRKGDTITSPQFTNGDVLETFDFVVANPPFSIKSWSNGLENEFGRFEYGMPPEKNGDYAFLLHILKSMKSNGKAAVILPHGVLFRGNAEAHIRRRLLKQGFIKGVIGLPANLFYGTGIPACIIILDKENASARTGVFMIDASNGFLKDGNKNRLRSQDMHKIVDVFHRQSEINRYSRMVPFSEIWNPKNDGNLNIARYIDSSVPEDLHDIDAHINGGIPNRDIDALNDYWEAFPQLKDQLFAPNREGYSNLAIDVQQVHQQILESVEFKKFATEVRDLTTEWFESYRQTLATIDENTQPLELIADISENLLARFRSVPLLDEYDAYEQLMTYWHETIHDDVFLIMKEGWVKAAQPRPALISSTDSNGKPKYEAAHIVTGTRASTKRYVMDLIEPSLVVAKFLSAQQSIINTLELNLLESTQALQAYIEEHGIEEGLIWDALDDSGKVTQKSASAALRDAKNANDEEVATAIQELLALIKREAADKKVHKDALADLDLAILKAYGDLSEDDVKSLVLDAKWKKTIESRVESEAVRLTLALVNRIDVLGERYKYTLSEIDEQLAKSHEETAIHLGDMGIVGLLTGAERLPGYDQPWQEVPLGEHVSYVKTVALSRAQLDDHSPTKYLHYGDIHTSDAIFLDAATKTMPRASQDRLKNAGRLQVGDLVFADASEDPAGVGKSVEISSIPVEGVVAGLHTIAARFDQSVLADGFKAYLQYIPAFRNTLLRLASGTKVLATTRSYISSITLQLPPVHEQKAIVRVLLGLNHEIELTELRLAKSRAIELGMRQELLTGRTRLPKAVAA